MASDLLTVSGRDLSPVGLGCSRIGSFNNPASREATCATLLARSLDLGVTVFDTADIYGQGDSEREIGRALAGRRDDVFVVTKVGKAFSTKMRLLRPFKPVIKPLLAATGLGGGASHRPARREPRRRLRSSATLRAAVDSSLRRLGFETVDGLLLHSPPAAVVRDPAVRQVLASLRRSGKVRHYGVSCDDIDALEAAAVMEGMSLLQLPLDLLDDSVGSGVVARLTDRGVAVFVREVIRLSPGIAPAAAVAKACRRPEVTSAIVGTSRLDHLREIVAAGAG